MVFAGGAAVGGVLGYGLTGPFFNENERIEKTIERWKAERPDVFAHAKTNKDLLDNLVKTIEAKATEFDDMEETLREQSTLLMKRAGDMLRKNSKTLI